MDQASRAAIRGWISQQHEQMERGSYYQLLGVAREAHEGQIRDAYYKLVARFHPDLYGDALDPPTRLQLVAVYSRLVEAYRTLTDGRKRVQYDRALAAGRLRWTPDEERAPKVPTAELKNPNAKRFFNLGRAALQAGDAKAALMNLKLAASVEESPLIRAELAKAEALLKSQGG